MTKREKQQLKIKNNSEAAYRIAAHLKMIDYELESMRDNNVKEVKKILSDAKEYYTNVFRVRLKQHFINQPEIFKYLTEHIEEDRIISLQALFTLMFDCNTKGLEFFYDALLASSEDEVVNNENQNINEYKR